MRTDTDPTPPHGIPRPSPADLAKAYIAHWRMVTDDTADRDALDTLLGALDALALAVWAYHHGDDYALRDALVESGRDWFGWNKCDICGEDQHRDSLTDHHGEEVCESCLADLDEMGGDTLDEIATNPFGGALDR